MLPESIGSTSWSTLIFTKTGLQTDMYYTFSVSAVNVVGESPQTESEAIITATIPGIVQSLAKKTQSKTHIEVQWSDPLDLGGTTLESYIVEMDSGTSVQPGVFRIMQIQTNTAMDTFYTYTYLNALGTYVNLKAGDIY